MPTNKTGSIPTSIATQKADVIAEYNALITGMNGPDLQGVDPIVLSGTPWTKAALIAKFQARVTAAEATKQAHTNLQGCVAAEGVIAPEADLLRGEMKGFLKSRLGKKSPKLQGFGFAPEKTRAQTAASKAAGAAKASATRKSGGKKAKADVAAAPPAAPAARPAGTVSGS